MKQLIKAPWGASSCSHGRQNGTLSRNTYRIYIFLSLISSDRLCGQSIWRDIFSPVSLNKLVLSTTVVAPSMLNNIVGTIMNNIVRSTTLFVQQQCSFNNIVRSTTLFSHDKRVVYTNNHSVSV